MIIKPVLCWVLAGCISGCCAQRDVSQVLPPSTRPEEALTIFTARGSADVPAEVERTILKCARLPAALKAARICRTLIPDGAEIVLFERISGLPPYRDGRFEGHWEPEMANKPSIEFIVCYKDDSGMGVITNTQLDGLREGYIQVTPHVSSSTFTPDTIDGSIRYETWEKELRKGLSDWQELFNKGSYANGFDYSFGMHESSMTRIVISRGSGRVSERIWIDLGFESSAQLTRDAEWLLALVGLATKEDTSPVGG